MDHLPTWHRVYDTTGKSLEFPIDTHPSGLYLIQYRNLETVNILYYKTGLRKNHYHCYIQYYVGRNTIWER